MLVLITCTYEESKIKALSCFQHFPHNKSMGAFDYHGNQRCDPTGPKTFDPNDATLKICIIFINWSQWYSSLKA